MAMVIPNGILNNPALGYVRQWIRDNVQIMAVVDMARELFQPKNDTQTSMVLMRRLSSEEKDIAKKLKLQYPIFMAVTLKIGHDKRGNAIYRQAPNGDDLLVSSKETVSLHDPKTGELRTIVREIKERVVDDELREAGRAYTEWLEKQ